MNMRLKMKMAALSVIASGLAQVYAPESIASSCSPVTHFNCNSLSDDYCYNYNDPQGGCDVLMAAGCTETTRAQCVVVANPGCLWQLICEYQ